MTSDTFKKPIRLFVGLGYPKDIRNVLDAYMFLNDAPGHMRNSAHLVAFRTCRAALLGEVEAETARGAFEAFVRKQDLLAPETGDVMATAVLRRNDPHVC